MQKESLSFSELKTLKIQDVDATTKDAPVYALDSKGRMYATGKRKSAVARVWLRPGGNGNIVVNGLPYAQYFPLESYQRRVVKPFSVIKKEGDYSVWCTIKGGGLSGQAGALLHGISRALERIDPSSRPLLKVASLLTRDSRRVERKKCGFRKARRRTQFSKR